MAYKKKFSKKNKKTYKRKSYAKKTKSSGMRKMVRREIARTTETKHREFANLLQPLYPSNSANFDNNNVIPVGLYPGAHEVVQGTGDGQRIGNKISVKKCMFFGTLVPAGYNVTTNPVPVPTQVKMTIFYDKLFPTTRPAPQTYANILDFNNGVSGFYNDLVDMYAPYNTDRYGVFKTKMFKLGFATNNLTAAGTTGTNSFANNDFKYNCNFKVDLTKYMIKLQKFQDNATGSTSRQLFVMFHIVAANGQAYASTAQPVELTYWSTLAYEDA